MFTIYWSALYNSTNIIFTLLLHCVQSQTTRVLSLTHTQFIEVNFSSVFTYIYDVLFYSVCRCQFHRKMLKNDFMIYYDKEKKRGLCREGETYTLADKEMDMTLYSTMATFSLLFTWHFLIFKQFSIHQLTMILRYHRSWQDRQFVALYMVYTLPILVDQDLAKTQDRLTLNSISEILIFIDFGSFIRTKTKFSFILLKYIHFYCYIT